MNDANQKVGLTYQGKPRACGFRFSRMDSVVLALAAIVTALFWRLPWGIGWLPAFVVGHFFLFCNVFRVRRRPELIWGAIYVANCAVIAGALTAPFWWTYLIQAPATVAIIAREMRRPSYHGIFARRISSPVEDYLDGGD